MPFALGDTPMCSVQLCSSLKAGGEVSARGPYLTLSQLLDPAGLPRAMKTLSDRLVVMRAPEQGVVEVPIEHIIARARRLAPVLSPWLKQEKAGTIRLYSSARSGSFEATFCLRVRVSIPRFSPALSSNFEPSTCSGSLVSRAFVYDPASRSARTIRALVPGEVVARFAGYSEAAIGAGERVRYVVKVGPVVIERELRAVQAAGSTGSVFVQAADGGVFAAPVSSLQR